MRSDSEVKHDVEAELKWDPTIDSTDIAVSVHQGVVGLAGFARTYGDKYEAEIVAKRVSGVHGVANDLEVRLRREHPDPEIARDAVAAIKAQLPSSWERIKVLAHAGWVTLEGELEWNFEKDYAENAVRRLAGIKNVVNLLHVKPTTVLPRDVKRHIAASFHRNAQIDADNVTVETHGTEVVLKGIVRTWSERAEAQRCAAAAPGVTKVDNQLTVSS